MNTIYAMSPEEAKAELDRLQSIANQHLSDNRLPPPESYSEQDALIDAGIEPDVSDEQIIKAAIAAVEELGLTRDAAIERLAAVKFVVAREAVAA